MAQGLSFKYRGPAHLTAGDNNHNKHLANSEANSCSAVQADWRVSDAEHWLTRTEQHHGLQHGGRA